MYTNRIIPLLLIEDGDLINTVNFQQTTYIGDPLNSAKIFNDKEVDELFIIDKSASINGINYELIEDIASECFMPVCYGGGIKSLNDCDNLFSAGIEKISINSNNYNDLTLLSKISSKFGSQSVVASIDVKTDFFKKKKLYNPSSKSFEDKNLDELVKSLIFHGAGELLITSINKEGCMNGLDTKLINKIKSYCDLPIVINGGVGSVEHIIDGFKNGANAVAASSFFVYYGRLNGILINYLDQQEKKQIQDAI